MFSWCLYTTSAGTKLRTLQQYGHLGSTIQNSCTEHISLKCSNLSLKIFQKCLLPCTEWLLPHVMGENFQRQILLWSVSMTKYPTMIYQTAADIMYKDFFYFLFLKNRRPGGLTSSLPCNLNSRPRACKKIIMWNQCEVTEDLNYDLFLSPKWPGNLASEVDIQQTSKSSSNWHVNWDWCRTSGICFRKWTKTKISTYFGAHIFHTSKSTCNEHVKQYWCVTSENFLRK